MYEPGIAGRERKNLAGVLRELRKAAGLSGERLALKAHMSQSKVSRIETGRILPTVTDVDRILRALAVPPEQAGELLQLARAANVDFVSRRQMARIGLAHTQRDLSALIESAAEIRYFLPACPPSLVQTEAYLRSNVFGEPDPLAEEAGNVVIAAKLKRGELLHRGSPSFRFVFTEDAVRFPMVGPMEMAGQVEHLLTVSRLPAVSVSVIGARTGMQTPPLNTFFLCDRRLVVVETHAGAMALRDPVYIDEHLELFEYFDRHAFHGDEARELLREIAAEFRSRAAGRRMEECGR